MGSQEVVNYVRKETQFQVLLPQGELVAEPEVAVVALDVRLNLMILQLRQLFEYRLVVEGLRAVLFLDYAAFHFDAGVEVSPV